MIPTWAAVLGALSLAVIALAAFISAIAVIAAALGVRAILRALQDSAIPVVTDVRQLVSTIRKEVDGVAETSRELRQRIGRAAEAAETRLADIATTVRTVQQGLSLWREVRPRPPKRRVKRRKS
ncbi:MAG: hypothetical protein ACREMF_04390 [Gemmatimonadales bacterium]